MGESQVLILNGGTFQYTGAASNAVGPGADHYGGPQRRTLNLYAEVENNAVLAGSGTLTVINSTNTSLAYLALGYGNDLPSPNFSGNIIIGGNGTQPPITVTGNQSGVMWRGGYVYLPLGTGTITINPGGNLVSAGTSFPTIPNSIILNGGAIAITATASQISYYTGNITLQASSTSAVR